MRLYLDTSALAKRYIGESGTDTVLSRCAEAEEIFLSPLCVPEMISALCRLKTERKITELTYQKIKEDFSADLEEATLVGVDDDVIRGSAICVEKTGLKTLDSLHVATAKKSECDLFLTADLQQRKAAKLMGLKAEEV